MWIDRNRPPLSILSRPYCKVMGAIWFFSHHGYTVWPPPSLDMSVIFHMEHPSISYIQCNKQSVKCLNGNEMFSYKHMLSVKFCLGQIVPCSLEINHVLVIICPILGWFRIRSYGFIMWMDSIVYLMTTPVLGYVILKHKAAIDSNKSTKFGNTPY